MDKVLDRELKESSDFVALYSDIKVQTEELESVLQGLLSFQLYTYEPQKRDSVVEKIVVNEIHNAEIAIQSFRVQFCKDDITVPTKNVGLIELSLDDYIKASSLAESLNANKKRFKRLLPKVIPERYQRRKFIAQLEPRVITSTIYREVPIAPLRAYSSSISWTTEQKAPIRISITDAIQMMKDKVSPYQHEKALEFDLRKKKLEALIEETGKKHQLITSLSVRVHPTQTIKALENDKTKRYVFNPSTPVIYTNTFDKPFKANELDGFDSKRETNKREQKIKSKVRELIPAIGLYYLSA